MSLKKIMLKLFNVPTMIYDRLFYFKKKKVKVEFNSHVNKNSRFEGRNLIARGSKVYNSFFGYCSYLANDSRLENSHVGRYTSIGPRVMVIIGEHPIDMVSTHPCFYSTRKQVGFSYVTKDKFEEFRYADKMNSKSVIIGSDVWIGADCRIIEGVTIGDGAIVLAGAIVTKNVPEYAVVGGVPAKIIRYRFDEEKINWLLSLKWWNKSEEWLQKYAKYFDDINQLMEAVNLEHD